MKVMVQDLAKYVKEYHLSGLMFNPRGIDIQDYKPTSDSKSVSVSAAPAPASAPAPAPKKAAGGIGSIMSELANKRTKDGSSAATGLKKVTRDQQTWRKEYKGSENVQPSTSLPNRNSSKSVKTTSTVVKKKDPVCRFETVGAKWIVENQTKESNANGVCIVQVTDPKEQVYMYVYCTVSMF